jgi:hypothetical protein
MNLHHYATKIHQPGLIEGDVLLNDDCRTDSYYIAEATLSILIPRFTPLEPIELPIDGILDLHLFRPAEVRELVPDYIEECLVRNILTIRIIHGKGTGTLRRLVHSILEKHPAVDHFRLCGESGGGWGATEAILKKTGQ